MIRSHKAYRRVVAVGLAGAALAAGGLAPSIAVAQSAGDEQYADPLAQEEAQPDSQPGGGNSGSGAGSNPASAPAPTTQQDSADNVQSGVTTDAPEAQAGLPRTGLDVAPVAGTGAVLLVAGSVLLWLTRPRRRRRPLPRRGNPGVLFLRSAPPERQV